MEQVSIPGKEEKIELAEPKKAEKVFIPSSIPHFIPVFTLAAILLGVLNAKFYYMNYGVDILEFMDLSEVLKSILNAGLPVLMCLFILLMYWLTPGPNKVVLWLLKFRRLFILTAMLVLITETVVIFVPELYKYTTFPLAYILIVSLNVFSAFFYWMRVHRGPPIFFMSSILLFMFLAYNAKGQSYFFINHHLSEGTVIKFKTGDSLVSSLDYYFIGQTDKYVFMYDEPKKTFTAMSREEISQISLAAHISDGAKLYWLNWTETRTKSRTNQVKPKYLKHSDSIAIKGSTQ
jgi:hypothetical protein